MEEAEKRMEAERERVQAADREEKEKQRAIRERKKAEKKKQWKKSHMLDDVILADVSSLTDKEDMDQIQHWSGKPNDTRRE